MLRGFERFLTLKTIIHINPLTLDSLVIQFDMFLQLVSPVCLEVALLTCMLLDIVVHNLDVILQVEVVPCFEGALLAGKVRRSLFCIFSCCGILMNCLYMVFQSVASVCLEVALITCLIHQFGVYGFYVTV